jgi:hypothetical protein
MPKWVKLVIAILLLPVCIGAGSALSRVMTTAGGAQTFWVALVGGAGCWLAIFLLLPKPMWVYVFGHELTHAISALAFGGKIKKFKASSKGGHVVITKTNFVIALAPYFLPLYAILVIVVFVLGHLIWNWTRFMPWFHFFLGAAYAFHITLTWHILHASQTDITDQGYLFSGVVIWLGNIIVLLIGVPLLTARVSVLNAFAWWLDGTARVLHWLTRVF